MAFSDSEKADVRARIDAIKAKLDQASAQLDQNQVFAVSLLGEATKQGVDLVAYGARAVTTNP